MVSERGIKSLLDIPCGDHYWMSQIDLPIDTYIGADIVDSLVRANQERFGNSGRSFVRLDVRTDELPRCDLALCRDCLDHLSLVDVGRALLNLSRTGAEYLMLTTYPTRTANPDIRTGGWRPLNLHLEPFELPAPLELIDERSAKPGYEDKSLGLWRVEEIPVDKIRAFLKARTSPLWGGTDPSRR